MITVFQIIFFSLLFSAFFFTGITTLFLTGVFKLAEIISVFPQQVQVLILTTVLLILFSVIFFYFIVRQYFMEKEEGISYSDDISCSIESIDFVTDETEVFEEEVVEEDISYSMESNDIVVDEVEVVELEDISAGSGGNVFIMGRLFTFSPGNPELLQVVESSTTGISGKVIYQRNGIHYINSEAFTGDGNTEREINNDFAQLVESVVNKA